MKYDLESTENSDAETLEHCLTVIQSLLDESMVAFNDKDSKRKWKEAENYLKDYIFELFTQQKVF